MNKTKWTFVSVVTAYIALFFLWAPLYMGALELRWYWLSKIPYSYYSVAYEPIITSVSKNNLIYVAYENNTTFWCNQFSTCEVEP